MVARTKSSSGSTFESGNNTTQEARVMGLSAFSASPVARSSVGESLVAYTDKFKEILEKQTSQVAGSIKVVPVPASASGLVVGAVAVVQKSDEGVAVFTFIIESTMNALANRVLKAHGRRDIEIPATAGDVYNDSLTMWAKVSGVVASNLGIPADDLKEAGACVIYSTVKADNEVAMQSLLNRATNATNLLVNDSPVFNAAADDFRGTRWTAAIDFNPATGRSGAGLPFRRSFGISLNAIIGNGNDLASQSSIPLSQLSGYVDLTYVGPKKIQQGYQMVDSTQIMVPRIVLTNTEPQTNMITPELQMLSLATSAIIARNEAWVQTLRPRYSNDGQVDIHSLNGLSVELSSDKQQVVVDVNDPAFNLMGFVRDVVHPTPVFTLHVEECGEVTWIMSMLLDAAKGNQSAYDYVYEACNNLTNGAFGGMFQRGTPIAQIDEDRVVLGTWTDKSGKERDLRDLDSLAMLNMIGFTDRVRAFEYSDTFNPVTGAIEERLEKRIAMMREVLNGQCAVKGYAVPVNLNPAFIAALYNALDSVARISLENHLEQHRVQDRTRLGMLDFGVAPGAIHQQYGYGPATGGAGFNPSVRSRW